MAQESLGLFWKHVKLVPTHQQYKVLQIIYVIGLFRPDGHCSCYPEVQLSISPWALISIQRRQQKDTSKPKSFFHHSWNPESTLSTQQSMSWNLIVSLLVALHPSNILVCLRDGLKPEQHCSGKEREHAAKTEAHRKFSKQNISVPKSVRVVWENRYVRQLALLVSQPSVH